MIGDTDHFSRGNLLFDEKRYDEAIESYQLAIAQNPRHADVHNNLGNALLTLNRPQEAIEHFQNALQLRPDSAETNYNLGAALQSLGRLEEAAIAYRRALQIQPMLLEAYNNLGIILHRLGRAVEAVDVLNVGIAGGLDIAAVYNNLGNALSALSRFEEAAESFRRALELDPSCVEAHNNLATALHRLGRPSEAVDIYRQALRLRPDSSPIFNNFGNVLKELGRLDEALACYDRAISLQPNNADAWNNLGNALKDAGELDKAIECYRRALAIQANHIAAHSALLYCLYFHPDQDGKSILEEHLKWDRLHAQPLSRDIRAHINDRARDRRLRIGYVSPDFREHVVGRFLLPLLANHDRDRFEIVSYSDVVRPDPLTARLQDQADAWHATSGLSDPELADKIREDQIDILVDLTMHMAGNRLLTFARKPAPVQVTWLAYCGTTGLETIDYRLSDPFLDPSPHGPYSETMLRLPRTYWCYQPPEDSPPVGPLPALSSGQITFGCLNNYCKISRDTWTAWIRLLHEVKNSRLMLHAYEGHHRQVARDRLSQAGIDPGRLEFVGFLPFASYLAQYQRIDIALDPFPYNGGTTTCDALWMGVPVVSVAGRTAVSRGGLSILSNIGKRQWVADDMDAYLQIAAALAGNLTNLAEHRATLRDQMLGSPLTDAAAFALDMEAAYRRMWHYWCRS